MSRDNAPTADAPTPPDERAVRVRCPHCGNRVQLLGLPPVKPGSTEVLCDSCGSSFHLDPDATNSVAADRLPATVGRFAVLSRLGRGAFGTVYKARDPDLDRVVAVKVPRAGYFATAEEEARFLREARAAARLQHPGIVTVHEVADGDPPAIISEFIDGVTLADRLTAGRPTFRESADLIGELADALDFAHRNGVVHRDVKPSNVLLDAAGKPHLADFGLARRDEAEITVTVDGQILGTPAYMSPEQAAGKAAVDGRADVYSLGVMLYELLAGERPFRGNSRMLIHQVLHDDPTPPRKRNDHIPRDLETICLKAMAKSPARRYSTAGELAADLRRWLAGRPVLARPVGRLERGWRWAKRNRAVAGLLAAVWLVFAAGVAVSTWYAVSYRRTADRLDAELRQAERREGELTVEKGATFCERGEERVGLLWLARGLTTLERADAGEDDRWHARLQLSLWGQRVAPRRTAIPVAGRATRPRFHPENRSVCLIDTDLADTDTLVLNVDLDTGRLTASCPIPFGTTDSGPILSGDGRLVGLSGRRKAGAKVTHVVAAWDARTGRLAWEREWAGARKNVKTHVLWAPDFGAYVTAGPKIAQVTLCDGRTGEAVADLETLPSLPHDSDDDEVAWMTLATVSFSPDGRTLLTRGEDGRHLLWDVPSGRPLGEFRHPGKSTPRPAVFSPDRQEVLSWDDGGVVRRWDARTGRPAGPALDGIGGFTPRDELRFSRDGRWLINTATDTSVFDPDLGEIGLRKVRVWGWPDTGRTWPHADVDPDDVSPDRRFGLRHSGVFISLADGRPVGRPLPPKATLAGYSRDGQLALLADSEENLRAWVVATGRTAGPAIPIKWPHLLDANRDVLTAVQSHPQAALEHWVFAPVDGTPDRITLWAQVLTGMELDADGNTRPLDAATLAERKRVLDELGGSPLPKR